MQALPFSLRAVCRGAALACVLATSSSWALARAQTVSQVDTPPAAEAVQEAASEPEPITRSALDAPLFYQLLVGEIELRTGEIGAAYQVVLDAARRTKDEALFRRATEIALEGKAGVQALDAVRAWRMAHPESPEALRDEVQLLLALNRPDEALEPMRELIRLTPETGRNAVIASLPRALGRTGDKKQAATLLERVLAESLTNPATQVAAQVALGRAVLAAGDTPRALDLARRAHTQQPGSEAAALLALELMVTQPPAEPLVVDFLRAEPRNVPIRVVYARVLGASQRYADAARVMEEVTRIDPKLPGPWLTLGALHVELLHPKEATAALTQFLQQVPEPGPVIVPQPVVTPPEGDGPDNDDMQDASGSDQGVTQAYLLLAQAAEQQRDWAGAERWLAKINQPQRAQDVQLRRASLLARQGKLPAARELIHALPQATPEEVRNKLLAEAHLLRDAKKWADANTVLAQANEKFPDDADLLYEQSMIAEKLNRMDDMERLLRRVIALKPDYHHAYNALGYSLADRNQRLPEARDLIRKALDLSPNEPFITDSLGWVEYRLGNRDEALRLLKQAYNARPDVEIGAHLGEVLWADGQKDEARRVLREARGRDAENDALREALARLKVDL